MMYNICSKIVVEILEYDKGCTKFTMVFYREETDIEIVWNLKQTYI